MPHVTATVSNLEASVERPVVFDIVRQVMEITQISSQTPIRFYGDENKSAQKGSTITSDGKGENRWNFDNKLEITIDENYELDRMGSTAIKEAENQFIFLDKALQTTIKPAYASTEVKVSFRYRSRDKNQANRWRNEIRSRTSQQRGVQLHKVAYHYGIPPQFIKLLGEVWRLREAQAGYGEDYNTYLAQHLTEKAQLIGALNGEHVQWVIAELQGRIQGMFEFEGVPEKPEKDNENGDAYVTAFNYRFYYDKPIQCVMRYPLVIHQQLLDTHWRPEERVRPVPATPKTYTLSSQAFAKFESDQQSLEIKANEGVSVPDLDFEFIPGYIIPATLRCMTVLCGISEEDKRSLLQLDDLPEVNLDADVLEFIAKSEAPFMTKPYASILHMSLYENQFLRDGSNIVIGGDLSVKATKDLNMRTVHRLRLSMVGDLSLLTPEAIDRLKDWPAAGEKILEAINAGLTDQGGSPDLGHNHIPHDTLCDLGFHYESDKPAYVRSGLGPQPGDTPEYSIKAGPCSCETGGGFPIRQSPCFDKNRRAMRTVQRFFISARPMSDYPQDATFTSYGPIPLS